MPQVAGERGSLGLGMDGDKGKKNIVGAPASLGGG